MQKIYNQISSDKAIINIYKTIEENENINKGWAYHNLDHIKNVTNIVETILNELNYSEELITKAKIASFMHDIGCLEGKEDHANRSYEYAKEYFKRNNINFEDIDLVLEAIKIHRDGFNTKNIKNGINYSNNDYDNSCIGSYVYLSIIKNQQKKYQFNLPFMLLCDDNKIKYPFDYGILDFLNSLLNR